MITKKKYEEAIKTIIAYEKQTAKRPYKIRLGSKVQTTVGSANRGKVKGIVVGYTYWRDDKMARVKRANGNIANCKVKNLKVIN